MQQIQTAEQALSYAETPVRVELLSDGLTDVTLLRFERLGAFTSKTLTLRPGQYTALGVRTGYRDVRIDFELKPNGTEQVMVRCEEAI